MTSQESPGSRGERGQRKTVSSPRTASPDGPALIVGGAGFIGANLAHRLLSQGREVLLFDNLSRAGVDRNLVDLRREHGDGRLRVELGDVRDVDAVRRVVRAATEVYHFAAQVAVTSSLDDPLLDFEVNAKGTLNVLEAIRTLDKRPPLIFTSTNKVYGGMEAVAVRPSGRRYVPTDASLAANGFSENWPLNFCSPYGCSKGAADQYVLDYARTFGLPATVFRMSCIYGPRQLGNEDQGWVAHFLIRALQDEGVTIYGTGLQVRDALYVDDLIDAFLLARDRVDRVAGQAFNVGGGPANTTSLLELLDLIGRLTGRRVDVRYQDWRTADQAFYVSDTRKLESAIPWRPRTRIETGVGRLLEWLTRPVALRRRRQPDHGESHP